MIGLRSSTLMCVFFAMSCAPSPASRLAGLGNLVKETESDKEEAAVEVDEATLEAYQKLGGTYGYLTLLSNGFRFHKKQKDFKDDISGFEFREVPVNFPPTDVKFGLILDKVELSDKDLQKLRHLKHLVQLDLRHTAVTDEGLKELKHLKNLVSLRLCATKITDAGLKELRQLPKLAYIDLSQTEITDEGMKEFKAMQNLRSLNLSYTVVSDAGVDGLVGLDLRALEVMDTHITPRGVKKLRSGLPGCFIISPGVAQPPDPPKTN